MAEAIQFEVVPFQSGWEKIRAEWFELFAACKAPCIFYHPILISASDALPVEDQPTHLVIGRVAGKLVWGFPARIRQLGVFGRAITFYAPAKGGWDHLAPLDASPDLATTQEFFSSAAWRLGVSAITTTNGAPEVTEVVSSSLARDKKSFMRQAFRCPCLKLPPTESELMAGLSYKFRQILRQGIRKAEASGLGVRIVEKDLPDYSMDAAFDNLLTLHAMRHGGEDGPSNFLRADSKGFHRKVLKQSSDSLGFVRIFELVQNGKVVASRYGYFSRDHYASFQGGFDPEFSKCSPGNVLYYHVMRWCMEKQVTRFDFLRGMDTHKAHWTDETPADFLFFAGKPAAVKYLRLQRSVRRLGRRRGIMEWARGKD